jgi:hypothetical protein
MSLRRADRLSLVVAIVERIHVGQRFHVSSGLIRPRRDFRIQRQQKTVDIIVNPIVDAAFAGGLKSLDWAVIDHTSKIVNIEAGVGFGLTSASDKGTLKLMISCDLN